MKQQIFSKTFFKKTLCMVAIHFVCNSMYAQTKLYTKEAKVSFFSKTAMENIDAQNNRALCIWDTTTSQLEFSVLIKGFEFDRALMQEHFNENYMESDKFPKATFKGKMLVDKKLLQQIDNDFKAQATGILTIHGVAKPVVVPVNISIKKGIMSCSVNFKVQPADYKISIPAIVADKINKEISISILVPAYKNL